MPALFFACVPVDWLQGHARFMSTTTETSKALPESGSRGAWPGEAARWSGASRVTKNFTARPTRLGWSGYDASEARSVHRESLWNPKRERAGLAISPRVSHRWPRPSQPVAAGPCNPRPRPRGRGEPHDALLTCHDAPTSGNVLASSSRQPQWRPKVCTDDWSRVKQGTQAPARTDRPNPNVCTPCVELLGSGTGSRTTQTKTGPRCQSSRRFGVVDMRLGGIRDGRPTVARRQSRRNRASTS